CCSRSLAPSSSVWVCWVSTLAVFTTMFARVRAILFNVLSVRSTWHLKRKTTHENRRLCLSRYGLHGHASLAGRRLRHYRRLHPSGCCRGKPLLRLGGAYCG